MTIVQRNVVLTNKDAAGNTTIDFPVTTIENVEGGLSQEEIQTLIDNSGSGSGDISLGYFPTETYRLLDNSSAFPVGHQMGAQFYAFDLGAISAGVPRFVSIQKSLGDDGLPLTCYGVTTIAASASDLEYCMFYDQGHTEFNTGLYPLEAFTLQVPYYSLDDSFHAYLLITGSIIQDLSQLIIICYQ